MSIAVVTMKKEKSNFIKKMLTIYTSGGSVSKGLEDSETQPKWKTDLLDDLHRALRAYEGS